MFEEACQQGQITAPVKFEAYADEWFRDYGQLNLRKTTYNRMLKLKSRTYAAIGHLRIDKITSRDVQKFVNSLAQDGVNKATGKRLAPKTIRHYLSFISSVFDYALKMQNLQHNPCKNVTVPKGETKEREIYSVEEVIRLLTLLEEEQMKYRVFFNLAVYSGLRRSELMGLEWGDFNLDADVMYVQRTSNYVTGEGMFTDETKTKKSRRYVKLPEPIFDLLRQYKAERDENRVKFGDKWVETDRLFVNETGKPMHNGSPYNWLKRFCKRKDMRFCSIHSMRHFYCSVLINAGVDVATVSGQLGHSNQTVTLSVYSHMFEEAKTKACDVITEALDLKKAASS
jgi:integrase